MTPPHQQKRKRCSTLIHRAPTLPWTQTPRWGMRVRMGHDGRLALEMWQKETDDGTHGNWEATMEEAKGLAYDDPQSDSDATIMGVSGSQGPELSLHDEPADSPPSTPRSSAPRWGHQWNTCCCWCPQSPVWTWSEPMFMRRSWQTFKLEAHIWA